MELAIYILLGIVTYLVLGQFLIHVVFREKLPDLSNYFRPGDVMRSDYEGFTITVTRQEKGFVYGTLSIGPGAAGPPVHRHFNFDESFGIENGELTLIHNGQTKKLLPGEEVHVKKGEAHKFYNETNEVIRAKGEFMFPERFAFMLNQMYRFMDENPGFEKSPRLILQLPLFQQNGFDSFVSDPPVFVQKLMGLIMSPIARMLGYKCYYPKYDPKRS